MATYLMLSEAEFASDGGVWWCFEGGEEEK